MKLIFNIENNKEKKELLYICTPGEDIQKHFAAEIRKLWPEIRLPSNGLLSFDIKDAAPIIKSKKPLTINGVAVQDRTLKKNDRIIFGALRLNYLAFETVQTETEAGDDMLTRRLPEFKFEWRTHPLKAAALIIPICAACIIAGCLAIPNRISPESHVTELATAKTVNVIKLPDSQAAAASTPAAQPEKVEPDEERLLIITPGASVPYFDLDILFIHAHPDDESLDFGCLLALAEKAGLKTGLLTFTDGNSGLDLYPDRPVTGIYPNHYMEGAELAAIRAVELADAAEALGVDLLIRLGLHNNQYNSIKDERPPEDIIGMWGGEDRLIETMFSIIEKTRPEMIAAPDAPSEAREHFEHEAVGYLVAEIMSRFEIDDYKAPKRYITCIDPRQHHLYPDASTINASLKPTDSDNRLSTLREVQITALQLHKTQNDAVNAGTGFLPKYPAEYYQIQYWHSNQNWDDWISALNN